MDVVQNLGALQTYGSEAWTMGVEEERRISALETWCYRNKYLQLFLITSIPEDLGGYLKFYDAVSSFKGETYSFIVNFLLSGVGDNSAGDKLLPSAAASDGLANCIHDLKLFQEAYRKREVWALKMIDASTQLQPGFLQGNTVDLGNFDECIEINNRKHNITGKHCFIHYYVEANALPTVTSLQHVLNGICVPSSCSQLNLLYILEISSMVNVETRLSPMISRCQTKDNSEARVRSIEAAVLSSFCVLGSIVLIASGFDIYLKNYWKRKQTQPHMPLLEFESIKEYKLGSMKSQRCLLAFSLLSNGKELFRLDKAEKSIKCLYGLRFIGACFVLSIHRMLVDPQAFSNVFEFEFEMRKWYRAIQLNAYLFVDLFFVMSGLLLSYKYSSHIKNGSTLNLIHYYLHRYLRLTPPLLVCVMLELLLGLLCNGPYCIQVLLLRRDRCIDNALYTLTYLNNMFSNSGKCLGHSWYLSADMQMYALAPFLFFFLRKYRRTVPYLLSLCLLSNILIVFSISYRYGFKAGYMDYDHLSYLDSQLIYYPFYTRMGPWFIGFALGLKLQSFNNQNYRHSKRVLSLGWIAALLCLFIAIFGVYPFNQIDFQHDRITDSLFKALDRNLFGLGFAWIIYVCYTGHCGVLNSFLSSPVMQFLGKISYSFYLIHPFVQMIQIRNVTGSRKYSDLLQGSILLGDIFYSLPFAIILYLAVEAPFLKLEKILHKTSKICGGNISVVEKP
ncbi:O-acyltransferase like protein [Nilaparvata lugens]|uniref:O-acyltransferase like protein n=1 Tax=Nilaparvata lugens TaxID=108931 RepID=UPI00193D9D8F|nr:O-acyltransferase like protein [Nilaparvata lugens]